MLDTCRIFIDFGLVVLIWIVQVIVYPSFLHIRPEAFTGWHRKYTRNISLIVFPLMLVQLVIYLYQVLAQSRLDLSAQLAVVVLLWGHTFLLAVPLHRHMEHQEEKVNLFEKLIGLNWWRVVGWNVVFFSSFAQYLIGT
jgi:hypothetical protein